MTTTITNPRAAKRTRKPVAADAAPLTAAEEAAAIAGAEQRAKPLQEKVVLLVLSLRAPGNHRTIRNKSMITTDADTRRLNVVKRLIEAPAHKAIGILDGEIRGYVHRIALPSPFREGTHAIPLALFGQVDSRLQDYLQKRRALVDELAAVYDDIKANSREKLGTLYRDADYLDASQLQAAYQMTWQYVTLAAPDQLRSIDMDLYSREQARLRAQWDDAIGDMRDALRVGLGELVGDMVGRLTRSGEDDKKFKPTKLLARFDEFLQTFDARNVTSDADLAELAQQARGILKGVSTENLVASKDVRARVQREFAKVQTTIQALDVEAAGKRRITFDDE